MSYSFLNEFHFMDWSVLENDAAANLTDAEKYGKIVAWAGHARGKNPNAFDALTAWVLDDAEWSADKLAENERVLMQEVIGRFKAQNAKLRAVLQGLASGVVNDTVFRMLDGFDEDLSGALQNEWSDPQDECLRETVAGVFADFATMRDRGVREIIAGGKTGSAGVNTVEFFGYINALKGDDASVQWALFMPDMVEHQQKGFKMDSFACREMPAMRFIGKECGEHETMEWRLAIMQTLDDMAAYKSGLDDDVLFQHHDGLGVDVGRWRGFWGRFMKADAPVPEGFLAFDFVPERNQGNDKAGTPFLAQFAYATFSGDMEALHSSEGYDVEAMYDITRNTMLGQGINIPYPDKYWTAEVFPNGCNQYSTAYMFSTEL